MFEKRGVAVRTFTMWMCIILYASIGFAAGPAITFKNPIPPDNGKRLFEKMCSGGPEHQGDCTFELADLNITAVVSPRRDAFVTKTIKATIVNNGQVIGTAMKEVGSTAKGASVDFDLKWSGTKAVSCNSKSNVTLIVEAADMKDGKSPETGKGTLENELVCNTCAKKTDTRGNGDSTGAPGSLARIQFLVTNLDDVGHPILLSLTSPPSWTVTSPLPPAITLASGESFELALVLLIPGDATLGSVGQITLISEFADAADSESRDTVRISVVPAAEMPTLDQWSLILLSVTLAGLGVMRLLGRRSGKEVSL